MFEPYEPEPEPWWVQVIGYFCIAFMIFSLFLGLHACATKPLQSKPVVGKHQDNYEYNSIVRR